MNIRLIEKIKFNEPVYEIEIGCKKLFSKKVNWEISYIYDYSHSTLELNWKPDMFIELSFKDKNNAETVYDSLLKNKHLNDDCIRMILGKEIGKEIHYKVLRTN